MKVVVTSVGLNLRKRPARNAPVAMQYKDGDVLELISVAPGNWLRVRGPDGRIG
jgi:hypothetical protein